MIKVMISGGGTGGHIFPAIAIANAIKEKYTGSEFLFVGALGKMEMEKVPAAGYKIVGLPITGIARSLSLKNVVFPFKLLKSIRISKQLIKEELSGLLNLYSQEIKKKAEENKNIALDLIKKQEEQISEKYTSAVERINKVSFDNLNNFNERLNNQIEIKLNQKLNEGLTILTPNIKK
jgi:hypothetical protein